MIAYLAHADMRWYSDLHMLIPHTRQGSREGYHCHQSQNVGELHFRKRKIWNAGKIWSVLYVGRHVLTYRVQCSIYCARYTWYSLLCITWIIYRLLEGALTPQQMVMRGVDPFVVPLGKMSGPWALSVITTGKFCLYIASCDYLYSLHIISL